MDAIPLAPDPDEAEEFENDQVDLAQYRYLLEVEQDSDDDPEQDEKSGFAQPLLAMVREWSVTAKRLSLSLSLPSLTVDL